ncbi:peptidoglycan-binding protein [Kitasatospora sp. NPDC051984]|uniref:peptidoglycan-binding protein n=1 Tax=Kitasatospora sp. NPDC051984 TaxID=3364059 RepID=UPI0037C66014
MHKINSTAVRATVASIALAGTIALATAVPADAAAPGLLYTGSHSPAVADLQRQLSAELTQEQVDPDGKFGTDTEQAVELFQTCTGITVDGVVGPQTRAALAAHAGQHVDAPCLRLG